MRGEHDKSIRARKMRRIIKLTELLISEYNKNFVDIMRDICTPASRQMRADA